MVSLFLSPQGRVASGPFWMGVIVLLVVGTVLSAAAIYGPQSARLPLNIVSIVLIYPQLCVFAKRLHDAGRSAWWFLAVIAVYFVIILGVGIALTLPYMAQMQEAAQDQVQMQALQLQMTQSMFLPSTIVGVVVWLIISFVVANLRSDPGENKYGPPTAAAATPAG